MSIKCANRKQQVPPVPCAHIADYYDLLWMQHKCIAWQFLRLGYRQMSAGLINPTYNNLFDFQVPE